MTGEGYVMTGEITEYSGFSFPSLLEKYNLDLSPYTDRQKIEIMEWALLDNFENVAQDLPVDDFIHDGMYYRALTIPSGVCLTGKIHHDDHICILEQGDLSVMTDDGMKRLQAPARFKARAGLKKIGYAHTDVVFSTVQKIRVTETTREEVEKNHFSDSDLTWVNDLMDYQQFLLEWGFDEQWVWDYSRRTEDVVELDELLEKIEIRESRIQGMGVFAKVHLAHGEEIGYARLGENRTFLGRYTNHSCNPNAKFIKLENNDLLMLATANIHSGDEIKIDYREGIKCQLQQ